MRPQRLLAGFVAAACLVVPGWVPAAAALDLAPAAGPDPAPAAGPAPAPASTPDARGMAHLCPPAALPPTGFADIGTTVFAEEIACLLGLGLTHGVASTSYQPAAPVTRGQLAVFLARAADRAGVASPESPEEESPTFADLDGLPQTQVVAIEGLVAAGVIQGYADGTFGARETVRRDQAASFLVRTHRLLGGEPIEGDACFPDTSSTVHREAIVTLCRLGVVQGDADGRYRPAGLVTRAQLTGLLTRLLDLAAAGGRFPPLPPPPPFAATATPVDAATAGTWRPGCPVPLGDLRLVTVSHWGFDGDVHTGELVVHADAVDAVTAALAEAYGARFPIERMRRVSVYGGSDAASMAANNTSAFNCREVAGTDTWSRHAYGRAIDVNPVQNPYLSGGDVAPAAGAAYLDRGHVRPGMVVPGGPLARAFASVGWGWGGTWQSSKDYQHFSADGR